MQYSAQGCFNLVAKFNPALCQLSLQCALRLPPHQGNGDPGVLLDAIATTARNREQVKSGVDNNGLTDDLDMVLTVPAGIARPPFFAHPRNLHRLDDSTQYFWYFTVYAPVDMQNNLQPNMCHMKVAYLLACNVPLYLRVLSRILLVFYLPLDAFRQQNS